MFHVNDRHERIRILLEHLADRFVIRLTELEPSVTEGAVMTSGPPPYRRLDCDHRALVYVRCRPRKVAVRMDLSGLWRIPEPSPLRVPSASGATLMIRAYPDVEEAVAYVRKALVLTRELERNCAENARPRGSASSTEETRESAPIV